MAVLLFNLKIAPHSIRTSTFHLIGTYYIYFQAFFNNIRNIFIEKVIFYDRTRDGVEIVW